MGMWHPQDVVCGCKGTNRKAAQNPAALIPVGAHAFQFATNLLFRYAAKVTAAKVIEEIKHLPREEQTHVIRFAFELARERQLSGKELSALAQRMVDSKDPDEVEKLKAEITRGFYGE